MKIRIYTNIAFIIVSITFLLGGCARNQAPQISTSPTSIVISPTPTYNSTNSETDYTNKLMSEGFSTEDIRSSESYLSRVILQLNEIETFSSINFQPSSIESNSDNSAKYSELLSKIDAQKALYHIVKLNNDLQSLENALNEYLLSLQFDLNIELYFEDKEKYNDEKKEKMSGINSHELITVRDIEEKALENLQNINNSNNSNPAIPGPNNNNPGLNPNVINPQPNIPTVEIPKPIDPSREISDKLGPQF